MLLFAIKMLIGDKTKYIGIILGLTLASFIISWQAAILVGIMNRTYGFISDTSQASIWVTCPSFQFIDDIQPLNDNDLYRVAGVEGVLWAAPLLKGTLPARLHNGTYQSCILIGIDKATFIGGPPKMIEGTIEDLRANDAIIVDYVGATTKLSFSPKEGSSIPLGIGDSIELNDKRAYVTGICQNSRNFRSQPTIYTTYDRATSFFSGQKKLLSLVLAKEKAGYDIHHVCARIRDQTGLAAYTSNQLKNLTILYYMRNTGIFINFGIAIILGFIIGTATAGQTLYNFTIDNLPYFAVFKAMGTRNSVLIKMVLLQALLISTVSWGIGIGLSSLFGYLIRKTELSFSLPLWLYTLSGVSILFISLSASFFCIKKVVHLDPAIVFKS
ncbi:MAG: ABC transporter permease [Chlamydiae bacterium]|nr:ABC transporter permease [Chlamydiota bacterium]